MKNQLVEIWYKKLRRINEKFAYLSYLGEDKKFRKYFRIPEEGFQDDQKEQQNFIQALRKSNKTEEFIEKLMHLGSTLLKLKRKNELDMFQVYLLRGKFPVAYMQDRARIKKKDAKVWIRIDELSRGEIMEDVDLLMGQYPELFDTKTKWKPTREWENMITHHKMIKLKDRLSYSEIAEQLTKEQHGIIEQAQEIMGEDCFIDIPDQTEANVAKAISRYRDRIKGIQNKLTD